MSLLDASSLIQQPSPTGLLPLSYQQYGWRNEELAGRVGCILQSGQKRSVNLHVCMSVAGSLDLNKLQDAMSEIVSAHHSLRLRLTATPAGEMQRLVSASEFQMTFVDSSAAMGCKGDQLDLYTSFTLQYIDYVSGPIVRVLVVRISEYRHTILVVVPHLIVDPWSMQLLARELTSRYLSLSTGQILETSRAPIQYTDYVVWQRTCIDRTQRLAISDAFKSQFGRLSLVRLPGIVTHTQTSGYASASVSFRLSASTTRALFQMVSTGRFSPFMILLTAYKVLLCRWTKSTEVVVRVHLSGRVHPATAALVGYLACPTLLRTSLDGNPEMQTVLARVKDTVLDAVGNDIPYDAYREVANKLNVSMPHCSAVMNVVGYTKVSYPNSAIEFTHIRVPFPAPPVQTLIGEYLLLTWSIEPDELLGLFSYPAVLFDPGTIERLIYVLQTIIYRIVLEPRSRLADVPSPLLH